MRTAAAFSILLLLACGGRNGQPVQSTSASTQPDAKVVALTPEQLGELGAQIRREPTRAEELLASRGLTEQTFEKAIRDVTENPDASKRYATAYRKASN